MHRLAVLYLLATFVDLFTTGYSLRLGFATEVWPTAIVIMEWLGLDGFLIAKSITAAIFILMLALIDPTIRYIGSNHARPIFYSVAILVVGVQTFVSVSNVAIVLRHLS